MPAPADGMDAGTASQLIWKDPVSSPGSGLLVVDLLGGRRRRTRQDASTTSHSHMRGLRGAQSRMTVLRREATLS
jgi:hypothetical protein